MYSYKDLKPRLFTEDGQVTFLEIRDNVNSLLKKSGAVRMQEATACSCGDSWTLLACVDRLVELGEIHEVTAGGVCGQYRVFVK